MNIIHFTHHQEFLNDKFRNKKVFLWKYIRRIQRNTHTYIHTHSHSMLWFYTKHSAHLNQARTNAENLPKASVIPINVESKELYRMQVRYARLPPSGPKQIQAKKYLLGWLKSKERQWKLISSSKGICLSQVKNNYSNHFLMF